MIIQYMRLQHFGDVELFDRAFSAGLNVIDTYDNAEIAAAIGGVLCSKVWRTIPSEWVREDTCLTVEVLLGDTVYHIDGTPVEGRWELRAYDKNGLDVTARYRHALAHCAEQDAMELFDGRDKTLPFRLCYYRGCEECETTSALSDATARRADTKTFRTYLMRYIRTFCGESLNNQKNYTTAIRPNGQFEVLHPCGTDEVYLSETEEKLFFLICFLNVAEFWMGMEAIRDIHHEPKPLLVRHFLEFLDESVRIRHLIARMLRLKRQVFIFAPPLPAETKHRWLGEGMKGE